MLNQSNLWLSQLLMIKESLICITCLKNQALHLLMGIHNKVTHIYIYLVSIDSACVTFYILHCFEEIVCFFPPIRITPLCQLKNMKELFLVALLLLKRCEAFLSLSSQNALGVGRTVKLGVIFKISSAFHLPTFLQSGFPH